MSERRKAAIDALRAETYGAEWVPDVADIALRAADAADRKNGFIRADTSDPAVLERIARALSGHRTPLRPGDFKPECCNVCLRASDRARAVLAALEES